MPLIGWFSGCQFEEYITGFDHWVAFVLLAFIGGKMILESLQDDDEVPGYNNHIDLKPLFILSVATSPARAGTRLVSTSLLPMIRSIIQIIQLWRYVCRLLPKPSNMST